MRFLPREEKFFHYFTQQAGIIFDAAVLLSDACEKGKPDFHEAAKKITELEHKGDKVLHEIFQRLGETFITPLDPEDIHALASLLDNILDYIEDGAHRMDAYDLDAITQPLRDLLRLIVECARHIKTAFEALEKGEAILDHCIEINRLEEEADGVERGGVAELFHTEKDPIRLLKYKEIYEILELATDACEDVADHLQNVVVKNS